MQTANQERIMKLVVLAALLGAARGAETAWFRKEHRKAKLSNPADCAACHPKMKRS